MAGPVLASLADVRRILRITSEDVVRDAQLLESLAEAEDWFRTRARGRFKEVAPATAKFFEVSEHAILHLPVPGSTVVAIRAGTPGFLRTLDAQEYIVMDDRRIRLRAGFYWPYADNTNLNLERERGANTVVEAVEVDYTPPTAVPAAVRGGIARLAASLWLSTGGGEAGVSGIIEEKIGDYSYKIGLVRGAGDHQIAASADDMKEDAMQLLRPHIVPRVSVT